MKKLVGFSMALLMVFALFGGLENNVFAEGNTFATVSAASSESMAIKTDGSLWAWGYNGFGQLGDGTTSLSTIPKKIMDGVSAVSASVFSTTAIKTDGSLWAWGYNKNGQLGDGTNNDSATPIKIMDGVSAVSASSSSTMAIKTDGSLWAWGSNKNGQLGDGTSNDSAVPIKIMDGVSDVSSGGMSTMAIKTDGSLWTWGNNENGQLGDGTTNDSATPIKIMDDVSAVSSGTRTSLAIKNDGSLWVWGNNVFGQFGNGKNHTDNYNFVEGIDSTTPIKIMDGVSAVSSGWSYTMAIKTDGSLWAWGDNGYGVLGDGTTNSSAVPIKIMDDVSAVSASSGHCLAIQTDGSLWSWGSNIQGELGNGQSRVSDNPTPQKIMDGVMLPGTASTTPSAVPPVTEKSITVTLDGSPLALSASPVMQDNRVLVPMRGIFEAMGATVDWNGGLQLITATKGGTTIIMQIGQPTMTVNGQNSTLDVPPQLIDNNTYVPVRAISEALGATVNWNGNSQTVIITTGNNTVTAPTPTPASSTQLSQTATDINAPAVGSQPGQILVDPSAPVYNSDGSVNWDNITVSYQVDKPMFGQCAWYVCGRFMEISGIDAFGSLTKVLAGQGIVTEQTWFTALSENNTDVTCITDSNAIPSRGMTIWSEHQAYIEYVQRDDSSNPINVYFTDANPGDGKYVPSRDGKVKMLPFAQFVDYSPDFIGYVVANSDVGN